MGKEVQVMPPSPGSSAKEDIMHIEDKNMTKDEKIAAIDAIAEDPSVTLESFAHLDINKILRKIDMRLVPMLTILYLLSFLDRGNIGNAKIEGLAEDLNLTGADYNWCLTAFFFTYCAFEVPSNMLLKKLRPSIWLPSIMVAWGIVMTLMGLVKDFHGLLIARIFLGVTEAGLFPGVVFYNTMWYCRYEVQVRQAYFFSAASVAGAFSGLLAYGISYMEGVGGLAGWRWIFILEGLLTFLVAIVAYFVLVDYPETASFLTVEERAFITYRLKYDGQDANTDHGYRVAQTDRSDKKFLFAAFRDWQIWVNIVVYWGYVCPLYGISLFLPTIIKELGYKTTTAQLLTVPIYVVASAITIAVAYAADRKRLRSPWILVGLCFQAIGFIMCISTSHPGVTYAGIFIAACALYQCQPSNITWLSNNLSGSYKRAVGMGIQISVGNLAGAMASNFYRSTDAPRYILGHGLEIGFICMGIVALLIQVFNYRRINKQREASLAAGEAENFTPEALGDLGDKAVTYRYTL
ncbi:MFS general substrate transporter [Aureobasidium pullulans]|nr:MFS general substrate transporter [Aureobasidium pullulans]